MIKISVPKILFNIRYTPYKLKSNASETDKERHRKDRGFYDLTGGKNNILDYITRKDKVDDSFTSLDYFEKSTKVFNGNGMISHAELELMKERLKNNKGHIWHGFISLTEEESHKIDSPEKCIRFVKNTFSSFLKAAHLDEKNIDLMCSLHKDRPHHLHIHFQFWEKEPKYRDGKGGHKYRGTGKISKSAIDHMLIKAGLYIDDERENFYKTRMEALRELKGMTAINVAITTKDEVKEELLKLVKELPKEGRYSYGSKDMEPYRERVDNIVKLLLSYDREARKADKEFYRALEKKKQAIEKILKENHMVSVDNVSIEEMEKNKEKYGYRIDSKDAFKVIDTIEADYIRRQGNLILNLARKIKPEYFERSLNKKYKPNDTKLKRRIIISEKKVNSMFGKFLQSFAFQSRLLERDFSRRLEEIEEEMKQERIKQSKKDKEEK